MGKRLNVRGYKYYLERDTMHNHIKYFLGYIILTHTKKYDELLFGRTVDNLDIFHSIHPYVRNQRHYNVTYDIANSIFVICTK